jgi:ABC-type multidrug transport system ATPase subunit
VAFSEQLTGREVLEFYSRLRRIPRQQIHQILNSPNFHFNGFFDKSVSQFSGGMIQRLGLAVACLPDAPVLVLDEPTVSLDPKGAIQFREFLASLKRAGKTIVFSSHMLPDVEQLADRVGIMVGGKLVALESVTALRDELSSTARLRVTMENADLSLTGAATQAGATAVMIDGNSLMMSTGPADRLQILRAIENAGGKIRSFGMEELSLEDVYMKYVNQESDDAK